MKSFLSSLTQHALAVESSAKLLILATVWLLLFAGIRPLMLPDEGRYVGIAWEMLSSNNWLVPTLDGMPFFHKPPLFYWVTALGLKIFGENEWAARLASTASAALAVAAVFLFSRKYAEKQTANFFVIALVTQPFFFSGAQFANLDMLVASMISITIVAGADAVLSLERNLPYRAALAACYVFAALGVLAKGLIGFVLPGGILLAWIVLQKKHRLIPKLLPVPLIFLFLLLAAPWFFWMEKSYDGFFDYFFIYHHFRRFAETGFNNQQAFWFYFPVLLMLTFPWSPWIFRICSKNFLRSSETSPVRSLMILWTVCILIFFSLPKSKLIGYILPALPPFAYLVADSITQCLRNTRSGKASILFGASLIGAATICIVMVVAASRFDQSGAHDFLTKAPRAFEATDQILMLNEYEYDLPFYLKARNSPWIISDWDNPDINKIDNWRKELHDAGQFMPAKMAETLITPDEFLSRLCLPRKSKYWIWGRKDLTSRYPFLLEGTVVFSTTKKSMWLLEKAADQTLKSCVEKP